MRRIVIIGNGGSGKSTLARELGRRLALPVHHLDRLFWNPGWVATPRDEFRAMQQQILDSDGWVIDGNYGGTMSARLDAADTIILLDPPTAVCLTRVLRRSLFQRERPDMGEGCRERLFKKEYADFLLWVLRYRRDRRPAILETLAAYAGHKSVHQLRSASAVADFLRTLQ